MYFAAAHNNKPLELSETLLVHKVKSVSALDLKIW
jgi:hypothetical protein